MFRLRPRIAHHALDVKYFIEQLFMLGFRHFRDTRFRYRNLIEVMIDTFWARGLEYKVWNQLQEEYKVFKNPRDLIGYLNRCLDSEAFMNIDEVFDVLEKLKFKPTATLIFKKTVTPIDLRILIAYPTARFKFFNRIEKIDLKDFDPEVFKHIVETKVKQIRDSIAAATKLLKSHGFKQRTPALFYNPKLNLSIKIYSGFLEIPELDICITGQQDFYTSIATVLSILKSDFPMESFKGD